MSEQDVDGHRINAAAVELARLASESTTEPIVAVTHAFVIGWILATVLEAPTATWLRLAPANAGLSVLDCSTDRTELLTYNDVGHLLVLPDRARSEG